MIPASTVERLKALTEKPHETNKATQAEAMAAVTGERVHQEKLKVQHGWRPTHVTGEFLTMIDTYTHKAHYALFTKSEQAALDNVRKIAALAIACMEENGVVERK